jgi:hypothetical protein
MTFDLDRSLDVSRLRTAFHRSMTIIAGISTVNLNTIYLNLGNANLLVFARYLRYSV